MRYLTRTLAVASLLAPAGALPLGIGDIRLHSALNQNLNADIALSLSGEKPSDIQVTLAPPDKFNEAGVPWSYFLSKLRFQTVTRPDGSISIKLTSTEPLKEPFLDFLLQVTWPQGNLYREFTVLVDPPAVYTQPSAMVANHPDTYTLPEPFMPPTRRQVFSKQPHRSQTTAVNGTQYGPTRRNDTLWKIAEQVRADADLSVEQVLIALYQQNPGAFYKDNVNALSAGKLLQIPERQAILNLSHREALAELKDQTARWNHRLADVQAESAPAEADALNSRLTLKAPSAAEAPANADVIAAKIPAEAASENSVSETTGIGNAHTATDLLQVKIAALEKQLSAMQQLVALKDQQLAALQNPASSESAITVAEPDKSEAATAPEQTTLAAAQPTTNASLEPEGIAEPAHPATLPAKAITSMPSPDPSAATKPPVATPKTTANEPAASESDSPFPYWLPLSAFCAVLVTLLGWLWWSRRKIEEKFNSESMFASSQTAQPFTLTPAHASGSPSSVSTESSFISEFSPQDFDAFDIEQTEIDPISEADVYLAYGRYQQAEELMRHAIRDFPEREDCKLKLLEIFKMAANKKAFEGYANELAAAGKKDDTPFWVNVAQLALDTCPDAPLFSSTLANFHMEDDEKETAMPEYEPTPATAARIDLIKDATDTITSDALTAPIALNDAAFFSRSIGEGETPNTHTLEFDLTEHPSSGAQPTQAPTFDKERVLDFDFKSDADFNLMDDNGVIFEPKKEAAPTAAVAEFSLSSESSLDLSFGDLALDEHSNPEGDHSFNFDFDLEERETAEDDVSDLTDLDALETKLDLARAYIDMGDANSAKDIVKEVLTHGTLEQQKMAQTLLLDIG